jgi:hypothetical protein
MYDYTPTRSRDGPEEFLKAFRGYLQADAYSGYDHFYEEPQRGIDEVACWAHARRKHYEAQASDLMRSTVMLAYIRLLYDVERDARDRKLKGEARRALRQKKSKPILEDIHAYLERERPHVLPKSPEGEAIAYTLSNWRALVRYCKDGDLEIDNTGAERSLRSVAVGRNYVHQSVTWRCTDESRRRRMKWGSAGHGCEHNHRLSRKASRRSLGLNLRLFPVGIAILSIALFFIAKSASTYM